MGRGVSLDKRFPQSYNNRTKSYNYGEIMDPIREKTKQLALAIFKLNEVCCAAEKKRRMSKAELCILHALDDGHPHSQSEICRSWCVPKTTINSITKKWETQGLLTLTPTPGQRRELQITLTDAGKRYAETTLSLIYQAEDAALAKTMEQYSDQFIEAIEFYGRTLQAAFHEESK